VCSQASIVAAQRALAEAAATTLSSITIIIINNMAG
jgi:hypothetical protein